MINDPKPKYLFMYLCIYLFTLFWGASSSGVAYSQWKEREENSRFPVLFIYRDFLFFSPVPIHPL